MNLPTIHLPAIGSFTPQDKPLKQKVLTIVRAIYDPLGKMALILIVGIALAIFFPRYAPPFFCLATTTILSRVVIKAIEPYNIKTIDKLKLWVCDIDTKFPKLQLIGFVFSVAMCALSPVVGGIVASGIGLFSGIQLGIEHSKQLQEDSRVGINANDYPNVILV